MTAEVVPTRNKITSREPEWGIQQPFEEGFGEPKHLQNPRFYWVEDDDIEIRSTFANQAKWFADKLRPRLETYVGNRTPLGAIRGCLVCEYAEQHHYEVGELEAQSLELNRFATYALPGPALGLGHFPKTR